MLINHTLFTAYELGETVMKLPRWNEIRGVNERAAVIAFVTVNCGRCWQLQPQEVSSLLADNSGRVEKPIQLEDYQSL